MQSQNISAGITMRKINQDFTYDGTMVLSLFMELPQVCIPGNQVSEISISSRIRMQVNDLYTYASTTLYAQAVQFLQDTQASGYPFRPYGSGLTYNVPFNQDCHLSLYRDQYEYTGGAHPNTLRFSDTWELQTGRLLTLGALFPPGVNYQQLLINQIIMQANANMAANPGIYFDDYCNLIVQTFNPESFYLTPQGLAIYYQQYDIAPYASGIIVFIIPYEVLHWAPACNP